MLSNKKLLLIIALVILSFAALIVILAARPNTLEDRSIVTSSSTSSTISTQSISNGSVTSEPTAPGTYSDYSEAGVAAAAGKRKVLFFHAAWCPSCRQQDSNLKAMESSIPSNVAIFKVDYDSYTSLRQKYGVTIQHTFVEIDDNGNKLQQWNTLYQAYDLESILSRLN